MTNGPILIVSSDDEDKELLEEAWKDLGFPNKLVFFNNGNDVLEYLDSGKTTPFIILCDVNMPKMNGFELKEKILEDETMQYKSIPFVFWSEQAPKSQVEKAYDLGGNGFFIKGNTFSEIKKSLADIVHYWLKSKMPE
jgi:CheY-like chemotaxis protein